MSTVKNYLNEADSYFAIVARNLDGPQKLGNNTLLSLSSMIAEKYLVSYLLAKSIPIQGHSIKSLLLQIEKSLGQLPEKLIGLSEIDEKLDLCTLSVISCSIPDNNEMAGIFANLVLLKDFIYDSIKI